MKTKEPIYISKEIQKEILLEIQTRKKNPKEPQKDRKLFYLALIVASLIVAGTASYIIWTPEGKPDISPERKTELDSSIRRFDNAEQYVLIAKRSKKYPCPSCLGQDSIFLFAGEIWKYGVTFNGKEGRYNDAYLDANQLRYEIQFKGSLGECYKEEKRKIFYYPVLPENTKRKEQLMRPPGNIND
jgi:hypothetical protein